jgi:hypothetical protein
MPYLTSGGHEGSALSPIPSLVDLGFEVIFGIATGLPHDKKKPSRHSPPERDVTKSRSCEE